MITVLEKWSGYISSLDNLETSGMDCWAIVRNEEGRKEEWELKIGFIPEVGELFTYTIEKMEDGFEFDVFYFPLLLWTKEDIDASITQAKKWEEFFNVP